MTLTMEQVELLLLIAAFVAIVSRRLRLPYTVGLVLAGTALALIPHLSGLTLTKDLVFKAFLPPLIFEAALQIRWKELRLQLPVTLTLATVGVLIAAGLTTAGIHFLLGWAWEPALLFGVLISATDPVSVIASFKEAGVKGRLRMLVESESLFNDGMVLVLYSVASAVAAGASVNAFNIAQSFVVIYVGGVLAGGMIGWGMLLLTGRTEDPLVEVTFTTIAAYGSFLLAEHFHLSGAMATLTAGMLMGNIGSCGTISTKGHAAVMTFWEYGAFVANSLIFLLIGVRLAREPFSEVWMASMAVILIVLVSRALAVVGCCLPFLGTRLRVPKNDQLVLVWGGMRGALSLALALDLPDDLPQRDALITIAFAVTAFSVLVQGLTMSRLLQRLGLIGKNLSAKEKERSAVLLPNATESLSE